MRAHTVKLMILSKRMIWKTGSAYMMCVIFYLGPSKPRAHAGTPRAHVRSRVNPSWGEHNRSNTWNTERRWFGKDLYLHVVELCTFLQAVPHPCSNHKELTWDRVLMQTHLFVLLLWTYSFKLMNFNDTSFWKRCLITWCVLFYNLVRAGTDPR